MKKFEILCSWWNGQTDVLHEWGPSGLVSVVEPDAELRRLVDFLKKKRVYTEDEAGLGYVTTLATEKIFEFFKLNCSNFISDLLAA